MGAVLFTLLTGEQPFKELKGKHTKGIALFKEKIINGIGPRLPDRILKSEDPSYVAIADAMRWCRQHKKEDRPTSQQVAHRLETALEKAEASSNG
jgi:hypothetical protein